MSNALITNGVLERIDGMSNEELDATYVQWKGILSDAGVTLVSKFQGQFYTTPKGISWKQDYIGILHKHMNEILTNLSSCDEVQRWKDCRDAMTTIARAIISKGSVSPHSDEAKQFLDSIQKEHVSEKPRPVYNKGQMITNDPMARTYLLSTTFWNILSEVNTYENYIECIHANETWEKLHFKPLEQGGDGNYETHMEWLKLSDAQKKESLIPSSELAPRVDGYKEYLKCVHALELRKKMDSYPQDKETMEQLLRDKGFIE